MKIIIKRILGCLLFTVLLGISVLTTKNLLEKKAAREQYSSFFESDTNFDVIFMGTSHAYNSIMPQELWADYGITSFNWGYSNCTLAEDYYLLGDICKYSSPRLVVIDLFGIIEFEESGNGKYQEDRIEQQHVQFDAIPFSLNKMNGINDVFDSYDDRWDFLFNLAMYHNRWKEISQEDFEPVYSPEKGASFLMGLNDIDYTESATGELVEINSACAEYIPLICQFCQENNIELLFVYLPYPAEPLQINVAYTLESYLQEYECNYINMLNKGILNYHTDINFDGSHVNYMGAAKITSWLGQYISENYGIEDHRNISGYETWDEDYKEYVNYKIDYFQNTDIYANLLLSYGNDFYVTIEVSPESAEQFRYDTRAWNLIGELEHVSIDYKEYPLTEGDISYATIINIYNAVTGELAFRKGYTD